MFIDKMLEWAFCKSMLKTGVARFATAFACFFVVIFPIVFGFFFLATAIITGFGDIEMAGILSFNHSLGTAIGCSIGAAIILCKHK